MNTFHSCIPTLTHRSAYLKRLAIGSIATASVAACLTLTSVSASAAPINTDVYTKFDASQMSITAPARVDLTLAADGTFIAPDASSLKIINQSPFRTHVDEIAITPNESYVFVESTAFGADNSENAVWISIAPNGLEALEVAPLISDPVIHDGLNWQMGPLGLDANTIELGFEGAVKNNTIHDGSPDHKLFSIQWTFAPGSATV